MSPVSNPASSLMRTSVLRILILGIAVAMFTLGTAAAKEHPRAVQYKGYVLDDQGDPLSGKYKIKLRYVDEQKSELIAETFENVTMVKGQFEVRLGAGVANKPHRFDTVKSVFAAYPKLSFEVSIDGVVQEPLVGVLPAGHSLKSRLLAAADDGKGDDDSDEKTKDDTHWKHYEKKNGSTSLQSGTLTPRGAVDQFASTDTLRRRPYTQAVKGPVLSIPVRDLPRAVKQAAPQDSKEVNPPRHESLFDKDGNRFGTTTTKINDTLAGGASRNATRTPPLNLEFAGVGNVTGVLPPDTEGTVGLNHYVHVVNSSFAVYNKSGNQLTGPSNTNTLWSGFGGACQTNNSGDAIFAYDEQADRYVLTQFAVASGNQSVCFAVSQTSDPTGSYYLYEVVTPRFPDYYKLGVWPDPDNNAYFFGTNSGSQGQYDVFAVDRANMLIGATARPMQFFQSFVNLMMPADLDGPTGPPIGSPGIFYTFRDGGEPYFGSPPSDSIDVWEFDVDWNTPGNTTFTLVNSLSPTPFNWTVCGFFVSNCLPQPGTSQGIDSASWWPMQRLVYRNFGTHQTLIGSWTVDVLSSGNRAGPRWFELRESGGGWSIFQEGTYSPDAIHRWMPSVAMDGSGNIAIGFSRGNGSNFPSIYYATRNANDPLGTMGSEQVLFAGSGSQTHSAARWGDYSSMELDPADDCTFWYTSEYLASTSSANWLTRVGSFTIPGCGSPPAPDFTVSCVPSSFTIDQGSSDTSTCTVSSLNGYAGSINLACSGAGGIACSFAPMQVTPPVDGSANSSLTLTVPGGQATGSYSFNVEGTGGATVRTSAMDVEVVPAGSNGPQNAIYNGALGAPACAIAGSSCDSGSLVDGRANLGPEPNQPNTLAACNDGGSGSYHSDESNDRIVVSTLDDGNFSEGDVVQITATVWAWSTGSEDTLDLYYTADATNPSWTYLTSIVPSGGGVNTLSAQYTLPAGTQQAVRAQFRYQSTQTPCASGNYNDRDDLVFAVESGSTNTAPTASITAPTNGGSAAQGSGVLFTGNATDNEDGNVSASLTWTSSINGAIGSGASFSTSTLSTGTHTITASVTDSGGLSDSDVITFTIDTPANTPPSLSITAPANGSNSTAGDSVTFTGTATDAEDGNISASMTWSSSLDGSIGSGASFSVTSLTVGSHTITASVNDSGGLSDSGAITVTVNDSPNTPPVVNITAPANGSTVTVGTTIQFTGTADDAEDGTISASLTWSSSLDGNIGSTGSVTTSNLSVGSHTITATVTDSGSLVDSDTITVTINPATGGDSIIWMSFRSNTVVPGISTTLRDEDIVSYNQTTGVWALEFDGSDVGLGSLEISGLAILPDGDLLLSFTAAGTIDGISVDDSDIVRFTPSSLGTTTAGSFSLYFDGSDIGMTSNGEDIDAITLTGGNLVISPLGSLSANGLSNGRDEDLLLFSGTTGSNTSGSLSVLFDGSDVGLANSGGEDVDAASFSSSGNLIFSTVGSFSVTGVNGSDEDIAEFTGSFGNATSGSFSLRLDLSAQGIDAGEDVGSLHIID